MTDDLYLKDLNQYYCTSQYYNVMGVHVTDGVKYVMDSGYSWFVTDAIAVIKVGPKRVRIQPFLTVELHLKKEKEAEMIMTDGDNHKVYEQKYKYTDAKRELKLYYSAGVLLLPSEN